MKKVGIGAGILLVILIGSALVVPSFIDWNKYKSQIETTASDLSDRKVMINGDLSLSILPSPSFSARDVSVSNVEGGQATNFISLKSVDVNVAFFPLLRGEIQVKKFILIEPVIAIEIDSNGKGNWEFGSENDAPDDKGSTTDLSFEQFQIEDGQISYQDFSNGRQELVRSINASVSMDSLNGPFEISGSARYKNLPVSAELMVGRIREGSKIPVSLNGGFLNNDIRFKFTGGYLPDENAPQADGKINIEANDIGDIFLAVSLLDPENTNLDGPIYNNPISLESAIAYGGDAINISSLEFEMGESRGSGKLMATFGENTHFDGNLTVNSFNLDSFLPAFENSAKKEGSSQAAKNQDQKTDYSFMNNLEGNFKFSLGALQYNEKIASQLDLDITATSGEIEVSKARLNMPGGSEIALNGSFTAPDNKPLFGGNINLNSGNFRAFLDWLKVDTSSIPEGRLTRFSYQGAVQAAEKLVQLYGIDGSLDTFQFSGGISYALQDRPSMGLDVAVKNLNVDNYLVDDDTPTDYKKMVAILGDFDANYKINMANVTSGGVTIKKFDVSGELFNGQLNAKTITVEDYAGFNLNGSLIGSDLASNPRFETSFNTTASSLLTLQRAFRFKTAFDIAEVGAVAVNARITGDFEKVNVDIKSTVGSTKADIKGEVRSATLKQLPEIGSVDLAVNASNPSFASLIDQFDLPVTKAAAADDRPFTISTSVKGTTELVDIDGTVNVAGGQVTLKGRTNLTENQVSSFDMAVDLNGPSVREFVRGMGADFKPAKTELGPIVLKLTATGNNNDVSLKNIAGNIGPTKITGSGEIKGLNADTATGAKPNFDFNLIFDNVQLTDFMEAPADAPKKDDWGKWSEEPLQLAVLEEYDGSASISANRITYEKYDFRNPRFEATLKNGVITISNFTGKLFGGDVAVAGTFSSAGDLNLDMALKNATIVDATSSFAGIRPVSGTFDMSQKISGKGKSQKELVSSLNGTGSVTASPGVIKGINVPELSKRLNGLTSQNGLMSLLGSSLSGGETPYDGGSSALTMKNGNIQLSPLDIKMLGANSDINLAVNLAQWQMNLKGDMSLSDHPDAPPIGISVLGALNNPKIAYNTKQIESFIGQKIAASLLQNMVEGNGGIGGLFGAPTSGQGGTTQPATTPQPGATAQPNTTTTTPSGTENKVTSTPLEAVVPQTAPANTEETAKKEAPAEPAPKETVEQLGTKLLERLFNKPAPKN
ncbi:MAG: AsmA family protein [Emcibacteraceae bacterium]